MISAVCILYFALFILIFDEIIHSCKSNSFALSGALII